MYGEKLTETKIENGKLIRVFDYKDFEHDYFELMNTINESVTDDYEVLHWNGVFFNIEGDVDSFEVDKVLRFVLENIKIREQEKFDDADIEELKKWVKPLKEAEGYIVHLDWEPEVVRKERLGIQ